MMFLIPFVKFNDSIEQSTRYNEISNNKIQLNHLQIFNTIIQKKDRGFIPKIDRK